MIILNEFLVFEDLESLNKFLYDIKKGEKGFEFKTFRSYKENKILFTAEHAYTFKIKKPEIDEKAFIGMGDRNTDKLAKLMAYRVRSGFLVFKLPRTKADPARSFKDLGKEKKVLVAVVKKREVLEKLYVPIHKDVEYLPFLEGYHKVIKDLKPKILVSIHGMHSRHKSDIVFGFGRNFNLIGGESGAEEFEKILKDKKPIRDLKIRFSKKSFTGESNYVLKKHVKLYNKNHEKKRFGMQIEFNLRGRALFGNVDMISKKYQTASQAIADSILEWSKLNA